MKKYVAIIPSFGFQNRHWPKGKTVELDDDFVADDYFNTNFKPIGQVTIKTEPDEIPEPKTMAQAAQSAKGSMPNAGMSYDSTKPKPEKHSPQRSSK